MKRFALLLAAFLLVPSVAFAAMTSVAAVKLTASKPSPQKLSSAGTIIFTAAASGGSGPYEFQFLLKIGNGSYVAVGDTNTDYSSSNTWSWTPGVAPASVNSYSVRVHARNQGSTAIYEKSAVLAYSIVVDSPTTGVTLIPDKTSPQEANTTVTFTVQASGGTGIYEYRFSVARGSGAFVVMENGGIVGYSSRNQFLWTPTTSATYKIKVEARNTTSLANYQSTKTMSYSITRMLHCKDGKAMVGYYPSGDIICATAAGEKGEKGSAGERGPMGPPGGVMVFDASQQFVGYLLGKEIGVAARGGDADTFISVFIPSINDVMKFAMTDGTFILPFWDSGFLYVGENCSGVAYYHPRYFMILPCNESTYCRPTGLPVSTGGLSGLSMYSDSEGCKNMPWWFTVGYQYTTYQAQPVTLPFTLPLSVPFRFSAQD